MINLDMDVVVGHGQNDFEELEMNSGDAANLLI